MTTVPGFNKNFKSYLHLKTEAIFWLIIIIAISLLASIITLCILYDRDIKNKSTEDKNLGLTSIITLAVGIGLLFIIIWLAWSSWRNAIMEDDIVSDLTVVAAQKPTLDQLQNKIGELVHRKLGNNNIDKGALTNYIFGRVDPATKTVPTELLDKNNNLIAARSGMIYGPGERFISQADQQVAPGLFNQLQQSREVTTL
tara:strand:+ start:997 stop:1593 length:597 start_codon:yes stop_codon:yes gene_type:complete